MANIGKSWTACWRELKCPVKALAAFVELSIGARTTLTRAGENSLGAKVEIQIRRGVINRQPRIGREKGGSPVETSDQAMTVCQWALSNEDSFRERYGAYVSSLGPVIVLSLETSVLQSHICPVRVAILTSLGTQVMVICLVDNCWRGSLEGARVHFPGKDSWRIGRCVCLETYVPKRSSVVRK